MAPVKKKYFKDVNVWVGGWESEGVRQEGGIAHHRHVHLQLYTEVTISCKL